MSDSLTARRRVPPPEAAWERLQEGNRRFLAGRPRHPGQDAAKRAELRAGQRPFAVVLGCSDSRVAAEIVFDQGLGDLFVVRTVGHVIDSSVLGSVEFGVATLRIPLVVVLGHDSCNAVELAVQALDSGDLPTGFRRDVVERITPSALALRRRRDAPPPTIEEIEAEHVLQTAALLTQRSAILANAVRVSRCDVIGAAYRLEEGRVERLVPARSVPRG